VVVGYPQSLAFAELLIDAKEDRTVRMVLVGMLRETEKPCAEGSVSALQGVGTNRVSKQGRRPPRHPPGGRLPLKPVASGVRTARYTGGLPGC
jgi:hypothetical protein